VCKNVCGVAEATKGQPGLLKQPKASLEDELTYVARVDCQLGSEIHNRQLKYSLLGG